MNAILKIRNATGHSQAGFARELGISQSAVSQYERNLISPDVDVAKKIIGLSASAGLVVTLDEIYSVADRTEVAQVSEQQEVA